MKKVFPQSVLISLASMFASMVCYSLYTVSKQYVYFIFEALCHCYMALRPQISTNYSAHKTLSWIVLSNSTYRHLSSNLCLAHLHWLPVNMRIKFKIATLTYKIPSTGQPTYLHHLLQPYELLYSIHSASQQLLHIPPLRTNFSWWAFRHAAPTVWNEIPLTIRESGTLNTFKRRLKSHLYSNYSYHPATGDCPCLRFELCAQCCAH